MGARAWHLERARHHKEASDFLLSEFPDWAMTALFYSAMQYVHSSLADEPDLVKDERHPRKHSSPAIGSRGVNQLVRQCFPEIHEQYRSLFEMSLRTRYDFEQLGPMAVKMLSIQWNDVKTFCEGRNQGRPTISSQAP